MTFVSRLVCPLARPIGRPVLLFAHSPIRPTDRPVHQSKHVADAKIVCPNAVALINYECGPLNVTNGEWPARSFSFMGLLLAELLSIVIFVEETKPAP